MKGPKLTAFLEKALYIVGSYVGNHTTRGIVRETTPRCWRYSIEDGKWDDAPELNQARFANSTCSFVRYIYTFYGLSESLLQDGDFAFLP